MRHVIVGLCSVTLVACGGAKKAVEKPALVADSAGVTLSANAPQWRYLEVAVAEESPSLPPLPSPGRVAFDERRSANVGSPLAGHIDTVVVRAGDRVKPGDRLFSIKSGSWAELERELEGARAEAALKKRIVERSSDLFALKAIPEKELLSAQTELAQAEAALKAAVAKTQSLAVQADGDNTVWMKAPRGGTVVDLDVIGGQEVTPDRDKPLLRISDLDEVLVLADVPEVEAADLAVGMKVSVRVESTGVERDAVLEHVSEVVDPSRRTVEVRARVGNKDRALKPNSFVEVRWATDDSLRRVRVPESAVVTDGPRSVVFIAKEQGRLETMAVRPGRRRDGFVELKDGLSPGSRYVAKGALLLLNQIDLGS